MPVKDVSEHSEIDQHLAALITNSTAIRSVTEVVEGTLGPKGLDCMLVDQFSGVLITNDGVTILKTMDVNHPAAQILIRAAEHQEEEVGDGTTTATILAGTLVTEGVNQVIKGVPVIKVIEGIQVGIARALLFLNEAVIRFNDLNHLILEQIALIAGRGHEDLAELITAAARLVGPEQLETSGFYLADQIIAVEGADNELIQGTIIDREPVSQAMPRKIVQVKVIILDDALEISDLNQALNTESGFKQKLSAEAELKKNVKKLADLGVNAFFTDRGISDLVEDLLTDLGVIGVQRVARSEWRRLAELTGARPIKYESLFKSPDELKPLIGSAAEVVVDEKFKQIRVLGYADQKVFTIIVGGSTPEIVGERERIAKDAAASVQAAWCGGVVPGGGSVEFAIAERLKEFQLPGMASYGVQCVIEALKRPLIQICRNAGFSPLEKIEEVWDHVHDKNTYAYGVNCDTGIVEDMSVLGIWDPYFVKYYAFKTAAEVSEAILRINTIIKMKDGQQSEDIN